MTPLLVAILLAVAAAGTAVALTRNPAAQAVGLSFFGLLLAVMFMAFQAPDVALSQIVIGAVALPIMVMLALATLRRDASARQNAARRAHKDKP